MSIICLKSLVYLTAVSVVGAQLYELNIVHYNDFHARFVETSLGGTVCSPPEPCIGGFARLTTLIRQALEREPDSILLNGGDSFQGTIWYNLLRWNVTQDFMNMLPHDAHALGNHEFDNGIDGVVPYLQHLNSPVVAANIIADEEPMIQGLFEPSIIVERKGRRIGIIGVIIATTNELASTGKLRFTDEIEAVRREAEKLNGEGVDIIVVLSHCGLEIDREIALNGGPHIDIIVGAHSHSLLINSDPPEGIPFSPLGPYPVEVQQQNKTILIDKAYKVMQDYIDDKDGLSDAVFHAMYYKFCTKIQVLIVQAAAYTAFLGEIKLYFNDVGDLVRWEGNPHFVGSDVEQASDVVEKLNQYLPLVSERANEQVGFSKVHLSSRCACDECNLGSFICDAFLDAVIDRAEGNKWNYAHFCVINQGGVRSDIQPGNVTLESVLLSTPFENRVEVFDLSGQYILEMLEYAVTNEPYAGARMVQVSGLRAIFDGARPKNSRVVNATVRCIECNVPRYEPLDINKMYKVVSQDFIATGGDGFSVSYVTISLRVVYDGSKPVGNRVVNVTIRCIDCDVPPYLPLVKDQYYKVVSQDFIGNGGGGYTMISNNRQNVEVIGVDYDVLMNYMKRQAVIVKDVDGRIQITDPCIVD